jgi:nucleotide-binding universal stress UspA family protein
MKLLETTTNISFKNILFLTDFSEASQTALAYALGLARHFKAQLFPAHACDPVILTEVVDTSLLDEIVENNQQRLTGLIKDEDIVAHPLFMRGTVEAAFPHWIKENGLQRFLLGSTAEFVFRNATCPVLTVGPHVAVRPYSDFKAENVLVPTDLGPHSDCAAAYALSFARETHAHLTFMHVVSLDAAFQRDRGELLATARKRIEKLIPSDARLWCEPELIVEIGDPERELLGYAETERPDMVVLGLPHDKKFSNFRTGVTYKLICSAPCPVLTVRDMATE